ncbi:MAG: flagellar biosynthesis protein FliQ [Candidatus Polarisedimenticolaceae bacterium]|nr:flagellar biosynthesis protein FliQ [Candidatus Polarisedimenticolaceae bacterium]
MTPEAVITLGIQTLEVITLLAGIVLLPALMIGLLVATFQAATQINEMTLTFIPKLVVIVIVLMISGPWMLQVMMTFTIRLIESIPELIR